VDKLLYVKLDIDPTTLSDKQVITATQFDIRADKFEKTSLNLLERIITSAGYSPQSFGLNIQGRAESGTALSIRERKSFATRGKKQNYWQPALRKLVKLMVLVYNKELNGAIDPDITINVEFSDSFVNNLGEIANSVKLLADAQAASVETKVIMLHPDWDEEQIEKEVKAILEENGIGQSFQNPDTAGFLDEGADKGEKGKGQNEDPENNEE
jgi:hypothetical protein